MLTHEPVDIVETQLSALIGDAWPPTLFLAESSPGMHLIIACRNGNTVLDTHLLALFPTDQDARQALSKYGMFGTPKAVDFDAAYDLAKSKLIVAPSLVGMGLFDGQCSTPLAVHLLPI